MSSATTAAALLRRNLVMVSLGRSLSTTAAASNMTKSTALRLLGLDGTRRMRKRRVEGPELLWSPRSTQATSPPQAAPSPAPAPAVISPRELRDSYFEAAKRCHPDALVESSSDTDASPAKLFIRVTEAYEYLRSEMSLSGLSTFKNGEGEASFITKSEEMEFRDACKEWLGIDAETVEESKRCPLFREWLQGNTDSAAHWNNFFCQHGGLAPKLRPPSALLSEGIKNGGGVNRRRRR